ncbi:MAG: divalent-cation tolerance protein CutA [Candidatus Aenigmarchaeota archaeon]|nr:divalent-cation tolerance protein CutA [Candidatus Aenigmarchaeota archaeon]
METDYFLCMTTVNSEKEVSKIKNIVLTKKLTACVNVISGVASAYHWRGSIKEDKEFIMIFKTKKYLLEKLKYEVLINHSYEIPEFIVLPIVDGGLHFFSWIDRELLPEHEVTD